MNGQHNTELFRTQLQWLCDCQNLTKSNKTYVKQLAHDIVQLKHRTKRKKDDFWVTDGHNWNVKRLYKKYKLQEAVSHSTRNEHANV